MELFIYLAIGLVAGFISSTVLKTAKHDLLTNTIIGAFGAYTATTLVTLLGVTGGSFVVGIVISLVGALALPALLSVLPSFDKTS
jgi:uncharacterized membrane protein YeaQ/YmgE (transglycosylase-associated protein family)